MKNEYLIRYNAAMLAMIAEAKKELQKNLEIIEKNKKILDSPKS